MFVNALNLLHASKIYVDQTSYLVYICLINHCRSYINVWFNATYCLKVKSISFGLRDGNAIRTQEIMSTVHSTTSQPICNQKNCKTIFKRSYKKRRHELSWLVVEFLNRYLTRWFHRFAWSSVHLCANRERRWKRERKGYRGW